MTDTSARRVGRPRQGVLSRRIIGEAALQMLDDGGDADFRMSDLARALGVRVSSLYNHVPGKTAVFAEIREILAERITPEIRPTSQWDDTIRSWARAYRDAFAAHPTTIALLAGLPLSPDSDVTVSYDRLVAQLCGAGWEEAEAISVIVAVEAFVLGSALDASAPPDMLEPGDRVDVPAFASAYRARRDRAEERGVSPADLAFTLGLDALIDGLRRRMDATS